jgi:hypothetical protein
LKIKTKKCLIPSATNNLIGLYPTPITLFIINILQTGDSAQHKMEDFLVHKEHNKILVNLDRESKCTEYFDTETFWNTTTWKTGKKIKITTFHLDLRVRMCRQEVREISIWILGTECADRR